jgi:hypothetical protein
MEIKISEAAYKRGVRLSATQYKGLKKYWTLRKPEPSEKSFGFHEKKVN